MQKNSRGAERLNTRAYRYRLRSVRILSGYASVALIADLILLDRYDEALVATRRHRELFPQVFPNEVTGLEAKLADAASKGRQ